MFVGLVAFAVAFLFVPAMGGARAAPFDADIFVTGPGGNQVLGVPVNVTASWRCSDLGGIPLRG